ncbi:hypothetical protein [Nioella aestuarii]|uniref:hypothetical protein n=1 Tax=Nioella aestuarii TaxID=1662864 RepID=UPI003D7FBA92
MRAMVQILTVALLTVPGTALAQDDCRASYSQWDLEDMLIEAFEALEQPDNARSSHCVFHLDLPEMDVPDTGAEMGYCRWQGVDEETEFHLDPEQPDQVAVMRGGEALSVLDLCDA